MSSDAARGQRSIVEQSQRVWARPGRERPATPARPAAQAMPRRRTHARPAAQPHPPTLSPCGAEKSHSAASGPTQNVRASQPTRRVCARRGGGVWVGGGAGGGARGLAARHCCRCWVRARPGAWQHPEAVLGSRRRGLHQRKQLVLGGTHEFARLLAVLPHLCTPSGCVWGGVVSNSRGAVCTAAVQARSRRVLARVAPPSRPPLLAPGKWASR